MKQKTFETSQLGYPFVERVGGDSSEALVRELLSPPTSPLDDEQKQRVLDFEDSLFNLEVPLEDGSQTNLHEIVKRASAPFAEVAPVFIMDATDGNESSIERKRAYISAVLGQSRADASDPKSESRKALSSAASQSRDVFISKTADKLVSGEDIDEPELFHLVVDPQSVLETTEQLGLLRKALREQQRSIKDEYSDSDNYPVDVQAKLDVLSLYRTRINVALSSMYPVLSLAVKQAEIIGDDDYIQGAEKCNTEYFSIKRFSEGVTAAGLSGAVMLDRIRQGVTVDDANKRQKHTAVDPLLNTLHQVSLAEDIDKQPGVAYEARYSTEQIERLKQTQISPETAVEVIEQILERAGISGWRVAIDDNKSTYSVQSLKDPPTYYVGSHPVSIYKLLVTGAAHELTHVTQGISDQRLSSSVKLAGLKGRGVSVIREAGARINERIAAARLAGGSADGSPAMTYAGAVKKIEAGGSYIDAARAFYKAKRDKAPGMNQVTAAREALDRALRIQQFGGYSSQHMAYDQEYVLMDRLSDMGQASRDRAVAISSFNLSEQAQLHRYGLIDMSESPQPIDFLSLALEVANNHIEAALPGSD